MDEERTLSRIPDGRIVSWVVRECSGYDSVLDFGCGYGIYLWSAPCKKRDGIEAFQPYVDGASDYGFEDIVVKRGDMRAHEDVFPEKYDVAMFIDSIEHLTTEDALRLLAKCRRHFKKVLVFAPEGEYENEPCDGNELQRHQSAWFADDFRAFGFSVTLDKDYHGRGVGAFFAVWTRGSDEEVLCEQHGLQ